jgi:hypothetical protein
MPKSYVPTDRVDLHQLAAIVNANRPGNSTWTGSGLTSAVATGEARQHRDHRAAARTAPAVEPASPAAAQTARLPRRLRKRRRAPLPVRPGVLPVATSN